MGMIFWEPASSREEVSTDQRTLVCEHSSRFSRSCCNAVRHRVICMLLSPQVVIEFLFLAWVAVLTAGRIIVYEWDFFAKPWNWLLVTMWLLSFIDACSFAAASGNVVRFARPLRAIFIISFAPQLRRMTASILVTLARCVSPPQLSSLRSHTEVFSNCVLCHRPGLLMSCCLCSCSW